MRMRTYGMRRLPLALGAPILLLLAACGSSKSDATPTLSVDQIFTAAVETFSAQQATELALTPPTSTPSPTLFPTLLPPSPLPTISFSTSTPSGGVGGGCNSSAYVSDVTIPDNTKMDPHQKFDKTWRVLNNGTCTWSTSYQLAFLDGDQMGGVDVYLTVPVPAGNLTDITVKLTAPSDAGTYKGNWQLKTDQGVSFGNIIYVQIKVGNAATDTPGTPTDTPTATP